MLFDRLPDSCVACKKEFDKTDIDMVRSWTVVVRNKENIVNLYCPPCIESAKKVIEDFKKKKIDDFRQSKKEQKQDG